jgi:hypothetical protein
MKQELYVYIDIIKVSSSNNAKNVAGKCREAISFNLSKYRNCLVFGHPVFCINPTYGAINRPI